MSTVRGIEIDREDDGRWIAELTRLPGVVAYGAGESEAVERVLSFLPSEPSDVPVVPKAGDVGVIFALVDDSDMGPRLLERMARRVTTRMSGSPPDAR